MHPSDLQKVCQWAKSNHSPSEVYNAACRLLDNPGTRDEELERLQAELAKPRPTFKAFRLVDGQRMAAIQRAEAAEAELAEEQAAAATLRDLVKEAATAQGDLEAERDALKAAIEKLRALCDKYGQGRLVDRFPIFALRHILTALDAPEAPEKRPESHGDGRNPQTQGASEGQEASEAQEASQ